MLKTKFIFKLLMGLLLMAVISPPAQAETLTVANGSSTDAYMPIYGSAWKTQGASCQFIYPASELANLPNGAIIKKIKFFSSTSVNSKLGYSTTEIRLGNTTSTIISKSADAMATNRGNMTLIFSGNLPTGSTEMEITCSTDFVYQAGQNLIVDTYVSTANSSGSYSQYWYVNSGYSTGCVVESNGTGSVFQDSKLPKMEITYELGTVNEYDASATPTSVDFGSISVNGISTRDITLRNTGANDLTYTLSSLSAPFSTTATSGTIAAGASPVQIPITFAPTTADTFSETLVISFPSETGLADIEIPITGSAAYEATICDGTTTNEYLPVYGYNHDSYNQTNQIVYPASVLTNLNGKRLTSITFYPSNGIKFYNGSVTFSLANVDAGSISYSASGNTRQEPSGLTAVGTITLPSSAQTNLTEWTLTFDDGFDYTGGDLLVDISTVKGSWGSTSFYGQSTDYYAGFSCTSSSAKTGQQFLPKVKFGYQDGVAPSGSVTVNPSSLTFGGETFYTGQTEEKTFTVTNTTEEAVTITMTGDNVFTFNPSTVAAGTTETITVTYAPTAAGSQTATLSVGNKTVTLTGTAAVPPTPTIAASVSELAMNAIVGTPATSTFTVTGANLEGDITVAATGEGFSVTPTTLPAAGGTVTVTYNPAAAGNHTGAITLTSANAETVSVTLNGTASNPVISGTVTPESLTFSCQEGQTKTATITVANTGNVAFTPAFSGIAAPFSIDAATEIAAGESKEYTVTYTPTAVGTHTGTLTVTINGETTNVALNGTAIEAPQSGEITVSESTSTTSSDLSRIAPIYGNKFETAGNNAWVQVLYPAELINQDGILNGKQITKVKFRHNGAPTYSGGVVEVRIGETSEANLSSRVSESTLKTVKTITGITTAFDSDNYLTFEFDEPYPYNGGNLVIQTKVTSAGSNQSASYFYGNYSYKIGLGQNNLINTGYSNIGTGTGFQKNFLPQATFTFEPHVGFEVEPESGSTLAFGEVSTTGSKTLFVTITTHGNINVPVTVGTFSDEHFSSTVTTTQVGGDTEFKIPIKFAPTTVDAITSSVIININGVDYTYTLTGYGRVNEPTMTDADFAALTYDWTDSEGVEHKDTPMNQVATTPEQMIALLKAVYTNKAVPGSIYRGFTADGVREADMVSYPAIGSVSNGAYTDSYGWGINTTKDVVDVNGTSYLDPTEYIPTKEGLTVLLVEMNDQDVAESKATEYGFGTTIAGNSTYQSTSSYTDLVKKFDVMFKSVRVLTSSKNMGGGEDAGTLFKIDCDKMNRFFLLAKGHLRTPNDVNKTYYADGKSYQVVENSSIHMGPFYGMFEQFSPNTASQGTSAQIDIYQKLVNMESYGVIHDCVSVPSIGGNHEFNLYGVDSQSDDCQDVRDMMFFIPERRMTYWYEGGINNYRDPRDHEGNIIVPTDEKYVNYNQKFAPKIGLFVIHQNEIEGEKQENANVYDLNLSWTSNLLDFLPGEDGVYKLYRVVTNADGTKTYQLVAGDLDPNTFSFVDHIEMQQTGQVVTYVVQGQDKEQFLTLQMSNERSFVIPGLDRKEQLIIALNSDYYFSRYDAATKTNNYSNSLIANNTVGTNVKPEYLAVWQEGSDVGMFKFWRATLKTVDGQQVVDKDNAVNFASYKVTAFDATSGGTLAYVEGADQTNFSGEVYGHGYHASESTSTISIVDGEVVFNGLKLYDNFRVSVEENTHPAQYVYYVTLKTAVPFNLNDEGTETSQDATSNTVSVPVYKTGMTMTPLTAAQVEGDVTHALPAGTTFDLNARYSSKTEILGYYIYRWADTETAANARSIYESNGDDASPQGQAGNQATYYTVAMNTDYTSQTENFSMDANGNHPDVVASFEDNYVFNQATKGDTYTYAPVVELFAPQQAVELPSGDDREDYNTYGGPQQMSAGGVVNVSVTKQQNTGENGYTWTAGGKEYTYYNVFLNVTKLNLPDDYEVAKVRAWRKIDASYLGEEAGKGYTDRLTLDSNGEYKFVEQADCQQGEPLGGEQDNNGIYAGTFGALKLGIGESIPMEFVVRVYFTKPSTSKADGDQAYYIAEYTIEDELNSNIPTFIFGVESAKNVTGIKYYNVQGIESDVPFNGVNIEVTTYDDGSRTTRKIMK